MLCVRKMGRSYSYDQDSLLAITSSITGILTFLAAVILGLWIRINNWQAAEEEFEEFERYLHRYDHKALVTSVELGVIEIPDIAQSYGE